MASEPVLDLGHFYYSNGTLAHYSSCHSFYAAFSVKEIEELYEFKIEQIYDADITYTYTTKTNFYEGASPEPDGPHTVTEFISSKEIGGNTGHGIFGKKYTWNRIVDSTTFIKSVEEDSNDDIDAETRAKLESSDFVFRFAEFEFISAGWGITRTYVEEFSVLRLHFVTTNGKTYNLGAVSDIVTGSTESSGGIGMLDNIQNTIEEAFDGIKMIFAIVIFILLFVVLGGPIRFIFGLLYDGIKFIFNFLIYLISIPIKIIGWIFKSK